MLAPLGLRGDFDAPGLRALAAWLQADRLLFKDDLHPAFSSYDQILSTGHDFLFGPNRKVLPPDARLMLHWFVILRAASGSLACDGWVIPAPRKPPLSTEPCDPMRVLATAKSHPRFSSQYQARPSHSCKL